MTLGSAPFLTDPHLCREEAVRQGRLANEAVLAGDKRKARDHIERARDLTLLAARLEQDELTDSVTE